MFHLSNNLRNMNQNNCIPTNKSTRNNDRTILAEMSGTSVLSHHWEHCECSSVSAACLLLWNKSYKTSDP